VVPPASHKVSRVSWYSGYWSVFVPFMYGTITLYGRAFQHGSIKHSESLYQSSTPHNLRCMVWALPRSLATTYGITIVFFSCRYLDVSVPYVSLQHTMYSCTGTWALTPSGFPHSDIYGSNGYLRLPVAFRSLSRPSSAYGAKAFTLCS
jgi:hypothetical protein